MWPMPQEKVPTLSSACSTISLKCMSWENHVSTYTLTTAVGNTNTGMACGCIFMRRVLTGLHKEVILLWDKQSLSQTLALALSKESCWELILGAFRIFQLQCQYLPL